MPVETGTTTGSSAGPGGGTGQGGQNSGLTTGYVGAAGTNRGAWSGDGQYLGLSTGPTIHGNTVFGPSGGSAIAHATMSSGSMAGMGMGPTNETYSNFKTPSGASMYPGLEGRSYTAPNFSGAMGAASADYARLHAPSAGTPSPISKPVAAAPPPKPTLRPRVQAAIGWLPHWPGTGQWWGNQPRGSYPAAPPRPAAGSMVNMNNQGNSAGYGPGYSGTTDGWGPGTGREGGYGSGGASFGY